jgi:TolB-like protein
MKIKSAIISLSFSLLLVGCTSSFSYDSSRLCIDSDGIYKRCSVIVGDQDASVQSSTKEYRSQGDTSFIPSGDNKLLADYVEQLAMQLIDTLSGQSLPEAVALTSFVKLGENSKLDDKLGGQISEAFYYELQAFGLAVVDVKTVIDLDTQGAWDFSMLKNSELAEGEYSHILTGTISHSKRGIRINARIINLKSKLVIASAKGLVPSFVIASM